MRSVGVCGEVLWRKGAGEGSGLKSRGPFSLVVAVTALKTDLSSEQAVEEASLWWRVRPVHVEVWAQCPVCLVNVDFLDRKSVV